MVLKEFAAQVKGFEREEDLVRIARKLQPEIEFEHVGALTEIRDSAEYDLAMMCTVLQHLSDDDARRVCGVLRTLAPHGHVLLIEKTEPFHITENVTDGARFISRARSVETYADYMKPFTLVSVAPRVLEPTYPNPKPGSCMLFRSPELHSA
jgi:trans-aconitate methyltransferase